MSATDRELLEAAAKAAYMPIGIGLGQYAWCSVEGALVRANANGSATAWNPLTSDGDALRLAVKLEMTLHVDNNLTEAINKHDDIATEPHLGDANAATRRAIVRAAAATGGADK